MCLFLVRAFLTGLHHAVAALLTGTITSRFLDPIRDTTKDKGQRIWGGGNGQLPTNYLPFVRSPGKGVLKGM